MKFKNRPLLSARLVLAALTSASVLLHSSGEAIGEPSFQGYVGSFIAANPQEIAPDIPFFDANGVPHRLSEYRGKVVLLNFWASWCPACIMEMPGLDRLQATLGGDHFVVLAVSQDAGGAALVSRFFESRKLEHLSVFIDDQRRLGLAFDQEMLPTSVLLDSEGREAGRLIGPADWASPGAIAFIGQYMQRDGE